MTQAVYSNSAPDSAEITSADLVAGIDGLTYRRLDFWCRQGYLRPNEKDPGSGKARTWTTDEAEVVRRMTTLVSAGMKPAAAGQLARLGAGEIDLGGGVLVRLS